MPKPLASLLFALLLLLPIAASAAELRLAVDTSTEMPWAQIEGDTLKRGIHQDLGKAIAARLARTAVFMVLPRQRLRLALERGEVDLACVLTPEWLPGDFDWGIRFIDDADVVLSLASARAPRRMQDLAGMGLGTVNGFRYPELEAQLGTRFVRDDAPNATNNLRKLEYGRIEHAVTNERFLNYQQKQGLLKAPLHPPLLISRQRTGCAVSRLGRVKAAEVSAAIEQLQRSGTVAKILAQYR